MTWQTTPYLLVVLVAALISLALFFIAWQRRSVSGSAYLAAIMAANAWWLLFYLLELSSVEERPKLLWLNIQYIAVALAPTLWLAFALEYIGRAKWTLRRGLPLLLLEPIISLLLAWSNPLHHWTWSSTVVSTSSGYAMLKVVYGPWSWVHLVYAALVSLTGVALIIYSQLRNQSRHLGQTTAILLGIALASIGAALDLFVISPQMKFTPIAVSLSGLVVMLALIRFRLLDIVPLARDVVIENMSDGVIILDASNHIVDLNLAARELIGRETVQAVGKTVEKVWKSWPAEMTLPLGRVEIVREVTYSDDEGQHFLDLRISSLVDAKNVLTGRLVVLRDITRQKRAEEALRRRDGILQAISFAAEGFLKLPGWEQSIPEVLARLGEAAGVSRVYLCENMLDEEGRLLSNQRYEWVAWGEKAKANIHSSQSMDLLESGLTRWVQMMGRGQAVYGRMRDFPESERAALKAQDALSIVVAPIFIGKTWWGYMGFDDCASEREWTSVEVDALKTSASTVGAAIQNQYVEEEARRKADVISTLLELSEIIGSTLNVSQVLERVVMAAHTLLTMDRATVFLWNEKTNALVPALPQAEGLDQIKLYWTGRSSADLRLTPTQVPLIRELQEKKQPIVLNNVSESPLLPSEYKQGFNIYSILAAPIVFQDRFVGVLYADYTKAPHNFTFQEIELAQALARQAGLAIERARLYAQSQQDADELSALYRASMQLINPGRDLQKLAEQITQAVTSEFSSAYCSVLWVNREQDALILLAQSGFVRNPTPPLSLDGPGLTVYVANRGEVVYAPDVSKDSRYFQVSDITRSELAYPLKVEENVIGVLNLESPELDGFDERSRRILATFADDATLALQNVRLFNAAQTHANQLSLLNEITRTSLISLNFNEMLQELASQMVNLINSDVCYINLWDEEHQRTLPGAASGKINQSASTDTTRPGETTLTAAVLRIQRSLVVEDCLNSSDISPKLAAQFNTRSALVLPLIAGQQKLGSVIIGFNQPHHFTDREIELCEQVSGQVALAISKAWSLEMARSRAQEADNLRQATAAITSSLDLSQVLESIMIHLEQVVPYDSAFIFLLKDDKLQVVASRGLSETEEIVDHEYPVDELYQDTIATDIPTILKDAQKDKRFKSWTGSSHSVRGWMGVPLRGRGAPIGYLALASHQPDYFTLDHARLASAFADQVAIAIENARLYAAEQARVHQLDALRATAADISAELELSRLLQTILGRAVSMLGATSGELGLYEEATQEIKIVASHNMGKDYTGTRMAMGEGAMGRSAEILQPLIIPNYKTWEGRSPQYAEGNWHTAIVSPLMVHGILVGTIGIMATEPEREFTYSDLQLLTLLAQQAAIAVENARLYQEAKMAAERRAVLHRASQEVVAASVNAEGIYTAIHQAAEQIMPVEAFIIALVDEKYQQVDAVYLIDKDGRNPAMRIPMNEGLSGRVIMSGKSLYIPDFDKEKDWNGIHFGSEEHTRSILAVPLRTGERVIGMIAAQSYQPDAYTTEDQHLLEMLAAHAAIAIENSRLIEEMERLAKTDPLTGLYNRRGLFDLGQHEVERFRRFNRPFSVIMIDLDHFKRVNDAYGHAIGDQVLIGLTKTLNEKIRDIDTIGRYGGEEIVVLLPETGLAAGMRAAERLRRYVENLPISTDRGELHITISMGVAEFKENTPDLETLLDQADTAMYQAKQAGRNQVRGYEESKKGVE
jgi:diguanylate cyclase (GGDEF)-like protein/PAS domain S-box-containing protein